MNFVVDDIGTVVAAMRGPAFDSAFDSSFTGLAPFYMYGHRLEIANQLMVKDKDKNNKGKKYPLIALRLDIEEEISQGFQRYNLNLIIATFTDKNYTAMQRYENVFKPTLTPIYDLFIKQLKNSGLFTWDPTEDISYPPHTKIDRPFWGTQNIEQDEAYIFNDPLDAIEIVDLKIQSRIRCGV